MREAELESLVASSAVRVPAGAFAPGAVFGDYRITAFLAVGGTAEVYCAEHIVLGRPAALKVAKLPGGEAGERIRAEARLLMDLHSLRFPAFYACGEAHGRAYLVEELLSPEAPSDQRGFAERLLGVCEAVAELHARGWTHGDLKPANIMYRDDGTAVLVDLGSLQGMGTRGYAAPEQLLGEPTTCAADVHALGIMAARGFAGKPPLGWRIIIRRATSSIVAERYPDAQALVRAVRRLGRLRVLMRMAAAVVVVLLAALAMICLRPEPPRVFDLRNRLLVLDEPIVLRKGEVCRVIGPGTLDAEVMGSPAATLWMTNCTVLNRAQSPCDPKGPAYELAGEAYLNFVNADGPVIKNSDRIRPYNSKSNHIRYCGPPDWDSLRHQLNSECFPRKLLFPSAK